MLRARSLLSARTLTHGLRPGTPSRPRPSRAPKLRLDTLESREQPGNVMSLGLAGAGMLEPLQVMAAAVGTKVPPKAAGTPGEAGRPTTRPALSFPALSSRPTTATGPDAAAGRRRDSAPPAVSPSSDAARAPLDFSDLSIAGPAKDVAPAPQPVSLHGGGSSGGTAGGSSASAPASQSMAQGPATFIGTPSGEADSSSPLATDSSAPAAGTIGTREAAAAPLGAIVAAPPAEVFVTPPADVINHEPPALSPPTVPQATTLRPTYAVGTDAGGVGKVRAYNAITGQLRYGLQPFNSSFQGGVRVAIGDVSGDGVGELVAGKGPGGDNRVKVFGGWDHNPLPGARGSFLAFPASEADGVNVAAGDINGDGKADVIVGADGAGGHRVRVWSGANHALLRDLDLTAYGLTGGIRVAAGDVNGDGKADVLVSGGAGSAGRVVAFDGGTGAALQAFFPFGADYRGGVTLAAGDVNKDGYADIITGQEAEGTWVKVFSGRDTASTWNLEAFPESTGGVRVGAADATGDGAVDVIVGEAGGGRSVRALAATDGGLVRAVDPFGTTFDRGLFVGGDGRGAAAGALSPARRGRAAPAPAESETDVTPTVTMSTDKAAVREGEGFLVTLTRSNNTTGFSVTWTQGGSATPSVDYIGGNTCFFMPGGSLTFTFPTWSTSADGQPEIGGEKVVLTMSTSPNYVIGNTEPVVVLIRDIDAPSLDAPTAECGCVGSAPTPKGAGLPSNGPVRSADGVRLGDGAAEVGGTDLSAGGFGQGWGVGRGWTSGDGYDATTIDGVGVVGTGVPHLKTSQTSVWLALPGAEAEYFNGSGGYPVPGRHYAKDTLSRDVVAKEFTLTTSAGAKLVFNNFDPSLAVGQRGQLKTATDPDGNVTTVTSVNTDGTPAEVQRASTVGGTTTTESYLYAYASGGVSSVTLRRQVGAGSWTTIRSVDYTYTTNGDLETAVVKDGAGTTLDTSYYRYGTWATGTGGALTYAVTGAAYERAQTRATALSTTVAAMADVDLAAFADDAFAYDSVRRVTTHTRQGTGCSSCAGGLETTTFAYKTSWFAVGYNSWETRTIVTQADGNTRTVYTNYAGQPMLEIYKDTTTGQEWLTFHKYDSVGREVLAAEPSAVSGYDESYADLLNVQSGDYQYLRNTEGLIHTTSYYTSTTATSTTAGGVDGYAYQAGVQRGESGTSVLQGTTDYLSRTDGTLTVYPVANTTVYRNAGGTGGQTTNYAYTYFSGAIQPESVTVTLPTVTTAQNGSNTATSTVGVMDARGNEIWSKDAGGFISYTEYDDVTGGVTKTIADVDTTQTGTFANLPSGWSTPVGGGLHLTTTFELDDQGRTTKTTSPAGDVSFTVFLDSADEVRSYQGWDSTSNLPTGPTTVSREDRARGYTETLTMSATPTVSSGRPTGAESISGVQSLSRQILNDSGQVVYQDVYISLAGTSYSASTVTLGTSGTNYLRTELSYDKLGRQHRTVTPTGTIYRTVYDGQGRAVSQWVGTDDTPTTGSWSPTNTAGTDLVKVSENEYDNGGVGDGNLTKTTSFPGGGAADRVTAMSYDWRNRQIATKGGVETSESTSLNRPIRYVELDNLGQAIVSETYDGDGLNITTDSNTDGVPDRPSSGALRAKSTADHDELGRVYQSKTFSVAPTSGTVSTNALVSQQWFNSRGMTMRSSSPGGMVSKSEFDGVGRTTKSYITDGGGDSAYADADDVTGDNVLSQSEPTYDADSNVIMSTSRERFHDETGTGALGTPGTGVKARVSYATTYFDKADRPVKAVDVGTNGGTTWSRPTSPTDSLNARSDTVLVTDYVYNVAGQVETVTDPAGLVGHTSYDMAGRTTKTIENYVNNVVSDVDDKTVEYTYHTHGQMKTLKAYLTSSTSETTEWVLGITSPVVSNDVLKEMRYPDASTGSSSSTEKDQYTYNQVGQTLTFTDRNGNVHTYAYDVLGRMTTDTITTLGTGVDGTVRRMETAYDTQGNAYLFTSYDATTAGNVVNQVQREFNGLGQLTKEWQAVGGAVNTTTSPMVEYTYSFTTSGSMNHSRLTSIIYPNLRVITYNYVTGLADNISRLSSITDGATTLESYDYLGYGIVVKRAHAQSGVDLTYTKLTGESDGAAGDKYVGLDRFGRIIDQRWTTTTPTAKDRRQYGYDRDSNRLYAENLVDTTRSELYAYDGLNQLTSFDRGTLNGTKTGLTGAASRAQDWDYDGLGNMDSVTTDGGAAQTRGHNKQNEITSISGATTPTYDANGNLTTDETGRTFKYDAWNRLVEVRNSGSTLLATYRYDLLGRRIRETHGSTTTDLLYTAQWQVIEERVGSAVTTSYVWSPVYVDAMICRDRDTDANGSLDERLYVVHDANFNVVALLDAAGNVVERYAYDSFGVLTTLTGAWGSRSSSSYAWVYLHQGGRWDTDTSVTLHGNRVYSPTLGRWLQIDPIGFTAGDVNLYRYVGNNPINALDPSGLENIDLTSDAQIDGFGWSKWDGWVPDGLSDKASAAFTSGTIEARREDKAERIECINEKNEHSAHYTAALKNGVTWVAVFYTGTSWGTDAAKKGLALLRHERVHLKIARYLAERATKEFPLSNLKTSSNSEGSALVGLSRLIESVRAKLLVVLDHVEDGTSKPAIYSRGYDAETTHGKLGPDGNPTRIQLDWETGYKNKVDAALNALPEWKALVEYAASL